MDSGKKFSNRIPNCFKSGFDKDRERQTNYSSVRTVTIFVFLSETTSNYGNSGPRASTVLFALALKLAQTWTTITDELGDMPIFLLDDVFGDLDPSKTTGAGEYVALNNPVKYSSPRPTGICLRRCLPPRKRGWMPCIALADGQVTPLSE